jgi:aryl-alcohol dehydrogenase-like predicted oxidoreductase
MNKYCKFAGVGLIPWGPLNGGFLARPADYTKASEKTTRDRNDDNMPWGDIPRYDWEVEINKRVQKVAADKGWKMSQVALAWINERVTSPIIGFSSVRFHLVLDCFDIHGFIWFADCAPSGGYRVRIYSDRGRGQIS